MKLGRLAIPTIAVAAIVLSGGAAAGLVAARAVLASESVATPTPAPAVVPPAAPTPAPINLPDPPDKLQPAAPSTERSTTGTRSELAAPGQGTAYTWEDGDRTLKVVLQDDLAVQKTADNTPADEVVAKGATDSIVRKQGKHGRDARPVFRSESGGGLMTLPGDVLLALDPEWDQDAVDKFFSSNNISADRRSELGFIPNGFLVTTDPGFPSLKLANELAAQDGVAISSPNWSREVEAK